VIVVWPFIINCVVVLIENTLIIVVYVCFYNSVEAVVGQSVTLSLKTSREGAVHWRYSESSSSNILYIHDIYIGEPYNGYKGR